jgi:hypothetical protein
MQETKYHYIQQHDKKEIYHWYFSFEIVHVFVIQNQQESGLT